MGIYDGLLRVYRNLRLVHMNLRLVHMNLRLVHMNLRLVHMNALCFSSIMFFSSRFAIWIWNVENLGIDDFGILNIFLCVVLPHEDIQLPRGSWDS